MNCSQFKDPVSNTCLVGTVVASWSVTQEVTGWQVHSIQRKYLGKTQMFYRMSLYLGFYFSLIIYLFVFSFCLRMEFPSNHGKISCR